VVVTIHDTSVRGNDLQLPINDLLYIEAQKNNVSVCYMKDDKAHTSVLHTTLTSVLTDLHEYENIFQCHRSFVVNLNNISSARGNSNGYQLKLGNDSTIIPLSVRGSSCLSHKFGRPNFSIYFCGMKLLLTRHI
jgi:DNA-binding LytR/AlgR family response regulator